MNLDTLRGKSSLDQYTITITRQFGSMGQMIAKKMSEILGIEYYEKSAAV